MIVSLKARKREITSPEQKPALHCRAWAHKLRSHQCIVSIFLDNFRTALHLELMQNSIQFWLKSYKFSKRSLEEASPLAVSPPYLVEKEFQLSNSQMVQIHSRMALSHSCFNCHISPLTIFILLHLKHFKILLDFCKVPSIIVNS